MTRDRSDESKLPPWLRGVPLPPRPAEPSAAWPAPTPAAPTPAPDADLPADDEMPDWLRGLSEAAGAPPPEPAQAEDVPDWLRPSAADSSGAAAPTPAPAEQDEDVPDWLRPSAPPAPASPPAPTPAAQPPAPSSADRARAGGFTGWLSTLNDPAQPAAPSPPAPTPTPPPAAPTPPPAAPSSQLPGWLQGGAPEQTEEEPAESLPDWLRDLSPASEPAPAAQPAPRAPEPPPAPAAPTPPPPAADIPAWLRSAGGESQASADDLGISPFSLEGEPSEPQAPAWLSAGQQQSDERPSGEATEWLGASASQLIQQADSPAADIPAWLREAGGSGDQTTDDDWLSSPASVSPSDPTLPARGGAPEIPAWLREAAGPPPDEPAPSDEAPPWLTSPSEPLPARPTGEATEWLAASASQLIRAEPEAGGDLPSWLRESEPAAAPAQPAPPAPSAPPAAPAPADGEDLPAWLRESAPPAQQPTPSAPSAPSIPAAPAAPAAGGDDLPAWLRESAPPAAAAQPVPSAPSAPSIAAAGGDDLPAWLRESAPPAAAAQPAPPAPSAPSAPPAPAAGGGEELPAWLRATAADVPMPEVPGSQGGRGEDVLPPWLRDESGEPLPTAVAPGDTNIPAWLRGTDPPPVTLQSEPPAAPASGAPPTLDWFDEGEPSTTTTSSSGLLGGAELPAWLRRETEKPKDPNPTDARSLDWLSRLGPYDDETAVAAPAAGPRLTLPPLPERTPAQIEALALLRQLVANPNPAAPALPLPKPAGALSRIGLERFLSVLLLMLLLIAAAAPGIVAPLAAPAPSPEAAALLEKIKPLGEKDVVLLGYEWDAQRVSELRPLEQAVIGQLIAQKVRVVLVSTDPQATLLQYDLRDQLDAAGYQGGGLDYILLGYRPGGEIALRQLALNLRGALSRDFQGLDATKGILATDPGTGEARLSTLDDFSMTIVLADEASDVQGWMEQVRPSTSHPIAFLVPASVAPFAQPYFRTPGVSYLAGTQDAQSYRQLRGDAGDAGGAGIDAGYLRLATLIFVALLAVGAVGAAVRETIIRRRSRA